VHDALAQVSSGLKFELALIDLGLPDGSGTDVVAALRDETFLVLPHPEVLDYLRGKTANYDRWLGGMQKLYAKQVQGQG
jgi:CheY-like chemotaxis protein